MTQQDLGIRDKILLTRALVIPEPPDKAFDAASRALVPSGTWVAMWGRCVLLLATIPLMSAARGLKCLATLPVGWPGEYSVKAVRLARYLRRLSLIVCSFWSGRSHLREYTMSQPLQYPLHRA
jgi:hypothetical protein